MLLLLKIQASRAHKDFNLPLYTRLGLKLGLELVRTGSEPSLDLLMHTFLTLVSLFFIHVNAFIITLVFLCFASLQVTLN